MQFNVINQKTLIDAQKNPKKYRNLMVRVAGYSAYFVELSLRQEPRADYVGYSFAFWEGYDGHSTGVQVTGGGGEPETGPAAGTAGERRHTVRRGRPCGGSPGITASA